MANQQMITNARDLILGFGNPATWADLSQEERDSIDAATLTITSNYDTTGLDIVQACTLLVHPIYFKLPPTFGLHAAFLLGQKYALLAPLGISPIQLARLEYYQQMWKDGHQLFKLDDGEAYFSLHDRSTSLAIIGHSAPGANDNHYRALLPLDDRRSFEGILDTAGAQGQDAMYQDVAPIWPADTNQRCGDPPLPAGAPYSRNRARCLICGFHASLAWRRRATPDRNFCQNFYCEGNARDWYDKKTVYPGKKRPRKDKDKDKDGGGGGSAGGVAGRKRKKVGGDSAGHGRKKGAGVMATAPAPLVGV